jgi:biotin carboxylase
VKPPAGAGAKATFRVENVDQLEQSLRVYRPVPGREMLLEEFLSGAEHSFDSVVIDGRPVWHSISRYYPTPLEVLENPWIQWCVVIPREVDHPTFDPIRKAGFAALRALGMDTGISHMEWFRRPDGSIALSEVAARPPGAQICSLLSYATDLDFYRAWARLAVYGEFEVPERRYAVGAAYLRGQGEGRVQDVEGLERAQQELGALVVEASLPRVGQGASGSYEGEGYVILRHPETSVVERAVKRVVELVRVRLG